MADSNVIREFLVSLGFKLEEDKLKKFDGAIASATKGVFALGLALEGMAVAVGAAVAAYAEHLETLYFASQRTGSSVREIKAFDLAMQNLGAQSGAAQSA